MGKDWSGLGAAFGKRMPAGYIVSLAAHNIWERDVVALPDPIAGFALVSEEPGLGVKVDEEVVESLKILNLWKFARDYLVVYPN